MFKKVGTTVLSALLVASSIAQAADEKAPATPKPLVKGAPKVIEAATEVKIPDIVARVDGVDITGEDFKQQLGAIMQARTRGAGFPGQVAPKPTRQDFELTMNALVDQKVVLKLVKAANVKVDDAEVQTAFDGIKGRFPSEEKFNGLLEAEGLTSDTLKDRIRESMMLEQYMNEKLDALVKGHDTSDAVLMVRYEELKKEGQLSRQESADVAHILVKVDGTDEKVWAAAKAKIDAARKRIVDGKEDFGAVAKEVTDDPGSKNNGGLYKDTPKGKMVPEFDKLTFELPVGEVSEPFKTNFGWHILRVAKRTEAGVIPFEEVKDPLKDESIGLAKQEAYLKFMAEAKKKIKVEVLFEEAKTDDPA